MANQLNIIKFFEEFMERIGFIISIRKNGILNFFDNQKKIRL